MWKKVLPFTLPLFALAVSVVLLSRTFDHQDSVKPVASITAIDDVSASELDAKVGDSGPEKIRPTAEQLSRQFFTWELRDLEKQAISPEDKLLCQQALVLRQQRAKELEISNSDFETNMKKALK